MIKSINKSNLVLKRRKENARLCRPSFYKFLLMIIFVSEYQRLEIKSSGGCASTMFVSAVTPVSFNPLYSDEESDTKLTTATSLKPKKSKGSLRHQPGTETAPTFTINSNLKEEPIKLTLNQILIKAGKRGIGGGIPGAIAGVIQVVTFMWLRTIINYQYRYGVSFKSAFQTLFTEGGVPRFYRGLWFALVQAPLSRFASTAANDGVESFLSSFQRTKSWGPGRGTVLASFAVGLFRIFLMPVDTCKIVLQVDSAEGLRNLMRKVRAGKINLLYSGALAQASSAIIAHYPWFYTYNFLSKNGVVKNVIKSSLLRNVSIGFLASVVSDIISNSIRVVKITKQAIAAKHSVGYGDAISMVLAADGWKGLFGRGLKTRIIANGIQSVIFTVIWRGLSQSLKGTHNEISNENTVEREAVEKSDR